MSSSEILSCSECGQHFDTIDALREHEKSEQQDKELQSKGLYQLRTRPSQCQSIELRI